MRASVVILCLIGCSSKPGVEHRAVSGDLAITHVSLAPGGETDQTVLIRDGEIVAVAPSRRVDTKAAEVIDGTGRWLAPGLSDMHVHVWTDRDLDLFLLEGVTTVRDLFGSPESLERRGRIARGELDGPTLIAAGPIIDGDPPVWPGSDVVTTPVEARAVVRAQHAAGYDFLKVYNGVSADSYAAIVDEAKLVGMPVAGHVPRAVPIADAIVSGQRTIEHLDGYVPFRDDPVVTPELVAATAASGVWNCATLVVTERFGRMDDPPSLSGTRGLEHVTSMVLAAWDPANDFRLRDWTADKFASVRAKNQIRRDLVRDLHRAGARLVLGTDTGNPYVIPGYAVHDELALLVAAGIPPADALHMATAAAAEMLGTPGAFGVITAGARADLVLVDRDPRADLGALVDPPVVIARGKLHRRDALLARLAMPASGLDALGALPTEGTPVVHAYYELRLGDQEIGVEQARRSRLDDGAAVIHGEQRTADGTVVTYRSTATALALDEGGQPIEVALAGGKATGHRGAAASVELDAAADAVVAPQAIAEFWWYADRLADLAVGASRAITAVEVMTEQGFRLDPGAFTFTRAADDGDRRVYDVTGTNGELALTGKLVVDADGAPRDVTLTLKWGVFSIRRVG